jgi:hypothetical protein
MTKSIWFILNLFLAIAAVIVTLRVSRQDLDAVRGVSGDSSPTAGTPLDEPATSPLEKAAAIDADERLEDLDELWRMSLFRPDRSEELVLEGDEEGEEAPTAYEFELIGIGVLGKQATATILTKAERAAASARDRAKAATDGAQTSSQRHVYILGQEIQDTGFTLSDIQMDEVEITKGPLTKNLVLKRDDKASQGRVDAVVKARESDRKQAEAEARQAEKQAATEQPPPGTPPPPPPPPPAPVPGPGGTATSEQTGTASATTLSQSAQERIREALERRREILERQKAQRE